MSYSSILSELLAVHGNHRFLGKPDCSPNPLDIMAIFAIYQAR